jgi:DNA repair protein RadC
MISKGGISGSIIDKRLVCKYAVDSLSSSVILVHNHPSGNLTPSHSDRNICKEITESLATFGIQVSDFLILTADGYLSFRDEGYM